MIEHRMPIPSRAYNAAVGGHVCGPEDIDFGQKVIHLIKYDKNNNEVSFESQVTQANKIYVIHDDFVLSSNVTIPANSILEFEGGSISGAYTITGINTGIKAEQTKIFGNDLLISGTWNVPTIYGDWFDTNNANIIARLLNLSSDNIQNDIYINNKSYSGNVTSEHGSVFKLKSNTTFVFNGTFTLTPNSLSSYSVFGVGSKKNVTIKGSGLIIGDRDGHIGSTEYGHGIIIWESENVTINGLTITKCNGDGIDFNGESAPCKDVNISGCYVHDCKRQCITTSYSNGFSITNCRIDDSSDMGGFGIDIEPNSNIYCINGMIENCSFDGNNGLKCQCHDNSNNNIDNIIVRNNTFNCNTLSVINILSDNVLYENNIFKTLSSTSYTISINSGKNVNIRSNTIGQVVDTTKNAIIVSSNCTIENNYIYGNLVVSANNTRVFQNRIYGEVTIGDDAHDSRGCIVSGNYITNECKIVSTSGIFTNNTVSGYSSFYNLSIVSNNNLYLVITSGNGTVCYIYDTKLFEGNYLYTEFASETAENTKLYTMLNVRGKCTINNNTFKIGNNVTYHDYFEYIVLNLNTFACINDTKIDDFTKKFCNYSLSTGNKVVYKQYGADTEKPSLPIGCVGNKYWDTTNSKELTWNGTTWVDITT